MEGWDGTAWGRRSGAVCNESSENENIQKDEDEMYAGAFTRAHTVSQRCFLLVFVWLFADLADKLSINATNHSTLCLLGYLPFFLFFFFGIYQTGLTM